MIIFNFLAKIIVGTGNFMPIIGIIMFFLVIFFNGFIIYMSNKHKKEIKEIFEKGTIKEGIVIGYEDYDNTYYDNSKDGFEEGDYINYYILAIVETVNDFNEKEYFKISDWRMQEDRDSLLSELFPIGMKVEFYEYNGKRKSIEEKRIFEQKKH